MEAAYLSVIMAISRRLAGITKTEWPSACCSGAIAGIIEWKRLGGIAALARRSKQAVASGGPSGTLVYEIHLVQA